MPKEKIEYVQSVPSFLQKLRAQHGGESISHDKETILKLKTPGEQNDHDENAPEIGDEAPQVVTLEKKRGKLREKPKTEEEEELPHQTIPPPRVKEGLVAVGARLPAKKAKPVVSATTSRKRKLGLSFDNED